MELRDSLRRRPVTPERRVAIEAAMLRIEPLVDRGEDAAAAIETRNEATGQASATSTITAQRPDRSSIAPLTGRDCTDARHDTAG